MEIHADGISIAHVKKDYNSHHKPHLLVCDFEVCEATHASRIAVLKGMVEKHNLVGQRCNAILPINAYRIQQVEAPNVEPDEMKQAVKWLIKDYLDFHIDDAVIDLFDLPEDAIRGDAAMKYVVAAKESEVRDIIDLIDDSGLELEWIDVLELSLKNLATLIEVEDKGLAVIRLHGVDGSISITKQAAFYFSRRFSIAADQIEASKFYTSDDFIIEVQRSLDYYERHLGQTAPANIVISSNTPTGKEIPSSLQENFFSSKISEIDIPGAFDIDEKIDTSRIVFSVGAIGAALRHEALLT